MMVKLQFETDNATHGLTQVRGFAWFTEEGISFEYQVMDSVFEVVKSDLIETFVPFLQVDVIAYKKSWFSAARVTIQLNSLKNLDQVPFLEETELVLELKRDQREMGKEFAVNAELELTNFRISQLNSL